MKNYATILILTLFFVCYCSAAPAIFINETTSDRDSNVTFRLPECDDVKLAFSEVSLFQLLF